MLGRGSAPGRSLVRLGLLLFLLHGTTTAQVSAQTTRDTGEHEQEPSARYDDLFTQGVEALQVRKFDEARDRFRDAHRLYPNARTYRALGMVEFEFKDYVECSKLLQEALDSSVRRLESGLRREVEALLQRARGLVGRVQLEKLPPGVVVSLQIDGKPGTFGPGQAVELNEGAHRLVVSARGYQDRQLDVTINGAEVQTLVATMQPVPIWPQDQVENNGTSDPPVDRSRPPRPWYKSPWLWSGVGALVLGGVLTGVLVAARDEPQPKAPPGDVGGVVYVLGRRP